MSLSNIRLRVLELTNPNVSNPDTSLWIVRAKELEAYVMAGGPSDTDPRERQTAFPQPRQDKPRGSSRP